MFGVSIDNCKYLVHTALVSLSTYFTDKVQNAFNLFVLILYITDITNNV